MEPGLPQMCQLHRRGITRRLRQTLELRQEKKMNLATVHPPEMYNEWEVHLNLECDDPCCYAMPLFYKTKEEAEYAAELINKAAQTAVEKTVNRT
jgi:hypothetical protein